MKILITGGTGFLGSKMVERLVSEGGHEIVVMDNMCTGRIGNIKPFLDDKKITYIKWDITDPRTVKKVRKMNFDQIYNFACPASPKYYLKFPIETWEASVLGVRNLLQAVVNTKTRLLQTSTSEVYGDPQVSPQPEEYWGNVNPNGVRACYDEGKRAAEALIFDYLRKTDVDVRVARIFNSYGPNMDPEDGRAICTFVTQALQNSDVTLFGDGAKITRSFCYVDDTVCGLHMLMESNKKIDGPINIGNPVERSIKDAAEIIIKTVNSKSKIVTLPKMSDDPVRRKPNIEKAKKTLGWEPKVTFEEGLKLSIEYFRKELKI
ncbi:MAG: GDP-mannose 4,6-dehydratase [Christensenellaceae bacterium]|jgi:UDP-glucuronate decarboxylase|nr:GDP-mannose 4,6-dehydratase [Christensenellaceae bacterium]